MLLSIIYRLNVFLLFCLVKLTFSTKPFLIFLLECFYESQVKSFNFSFKLELSILYELVAYAVTPKVYHFELHLFVLYIEVCSIVVSRL